VKQDDQIPFRALRAAAIQWKNDPRERLKQLDKASERMANGVLAEALGLEYLLLNDPATAGRWFRTAKGHYPSDVDQLRQEIHLISIERTANRKDVAIRSLRDALVQFGSIPESEALKGWLDILDPPPPPPADPTKAPDLKKP
jgi:hypothetical protein